MRSVDEVRSLILKAFDGVPVPCAENLHSADEIRKYLSGRQWSDIESGWLNQYWVYFSSLEPSGYQYYLPALLIASLNQLPGTDSIARPVIYSLAPSTQSVFYDGRDGDLDRRTSLFTQSQLEAVSAFHGLYIQDEPLYCLTSHAARNLVCGWNRMDTPELRQADQFFERMRHWRSSTHPPLPEVGSLAAEIENAFAKTPYPGDDNIIDVTDDEAADSALDFRGARWQSLHPLLLRDNYTSMSFATPDGFRYLLPAYLMAELRGLDQDSNVDCVFHLTHGFSPYQPHTFNLEPLDEVVQQFVSILPDGMSADQLKAKIRENEEQSAKMDRRPYREKMLAKLSRQERLAVIHYLEYRLTVDDFDSPEIKNALEIYWQPSVRLRAQ